MEGAILRHEGRPCMFASLPASPSDLPSAPSLPGVLAVEAELIAPATPAAGISHFAGLLDQAAAPFLSVPVLPAPVPVETDTPSESPTDFSSLLDTPVAPDEPDSNPERARTTNSDGCSAHQHSVPVPGTAPIIATTAAPSANVPSLSSRHVPLRPAGLRTTALPAQGAPSPTAPVSARSTEPEQPASSEAPASVRTSLRLSEPSAPDARISANLPPIEFPPATAPASSKSEYVVENRPSSQRSPDSTGFPLSHATNIPQPSPAASPFTYTSVVTTTSPVQSATFASPSHPTIAPQPDLAADIVTTPAASERAPALPRTPTTPCPLPQGVPTPPALFSAYAPSTAPTEYNIDPIIPNNIKYSVDSKVFKKSQNTIGTEQAKPSFDMAPSAQFTAPAPASAAIPAGVQVSAPVARAESNAPAESSEAVLLVQKVTALGDHLLVRPAEQVSVRIDLDDTNHVDVRIALHGGKVRADFQTNSASLRTALADAWQDFAQKTPGADQRWADPSFTTVSAQPGVSSIPAPAPAGTSSTEAATAFTSDQGSARREAPARFSDYTPGGFSSRHAATAPLSGGSSTVSSRPADPSRQLDLLA